MSMFYFLEAFRIYSRNASLRRRGFAACGRLAVALFVLFGVAGLAVAQSKPIPAEAQFRKITAAEQRVIEARLVKKKSELMREEEIGRAAVAGVFRKWQADPRDGALPRIFDPETKSRSPYEDNVKRYVKRANAPWPEPPATFEAQKTYVTCVLAQVAGSYRSLEQHLDQTIENVRDSKDDPKFVERSVREILNDEPGNSDTACRAGEPAYQTNSLPLSAEWNSKCLQSDSLLSDGSVKPYQPTTAALMYDDGRNGQRTYCSGTLIAPDAILTAAHCVCETTAKDARGTNYTTAGECAAGRYSRLGRGVSTLDPANHSVFLQHAGHFTVKRVVVNPEFRWTDGWLRADLAILFLQEPVKGIRPIPLNTYRRVPANTPAASVGYGAHNPIDETGKITMTDAIVERAGLKLQAQVRTGQCDIFAQSRRLICWDYNAGRDSGGLKLGSTCRGDSGGPLYAGQGNGTVLVGVTSAGGPSCKPGDTPTYDTEVFAYRHWIAQQVLANSTGQYPGGVAAYGSQNSSVPLLAALNSNPDASSAYPADRIKQLACSFCVMCGQDREVEIPDNVRTLRVSVNCTPDDLARGRNIELKVKNVKDDTVACSDGQSRETTALSCAAPVSPKQKLRIEVAAGLFQQCQIVATTSN